VHELVGHAIQACRSGDPRVIQRWRIRRERNGHLSPPPRAGRRKLHPPMPICTTRSTRCGARIRNSELLIRQVAVVNVRFGRTFIHARARREKSELLPAKDTVASKKPARARLPSGLCANKRANYDGRSTKVSRVTREVSALGDVTEDSIAGSQGRRESRGVGGGGD